jgi:hypothetical protein
VRCASSTAVSSVEVMAGVFWVGTKIVFIVSSRPLQMNDGQGSHNGTDFQHAKPSGQNRQRRVHCEMMARRIAAPEMRSHSGAMR